MNTEGAFASLIIGGGLAFVWKIMGDPYGIDATWVAIPVSFIASTIVRLITAPPGDEIEKTYYYTDQFKLSKERIKTSV